MFLLKPTFEWFTNYHVWVPEFVHVVSEELETQVVHFISGCLNPASDIVGVSDNNVRCQPRTCEVLLIYLDNAGSWARKKICTAPKIDLQLNDPWTVIEGAAAAFLKGFNMNPQWISMMLLEHPQWDLAGMMKFVYNFKHVTVSRSTKSTADLRFP